MDKEESFSQFYDKLEEIIDDMFPERHRLSKFELDFYVDSIIMNCEDYYTDKNKTATDHSYYNDKNGKDLFYHFENGLMSYEMNKGFYTGNIFKYIFRHGKKDPEAEVEDLKKGRDYLNELIKITEEKIDNQ